MSAEAPLVRARGVRKSFGQREVLCGIDLEVHSGEVVVILGPSGSGKSTLLRCINNLKTMSAGSIEVGGEQIGYRFEGKRLHRSGRTPRRGSGGTSAWCSSSSISIRI